MRYSTISQIGDFTAFEGAATDFLRFDPDRCSGGDDAPLRTTVQPIPGGDGVYVNPPLDDGQIITLGGDLVIGSASDEAGYIAAEDTLLAALKSALAALKIAPDDFVYSAGTVQVWKYAGIVGSRNGMLKGVTFSVIVDVTA